jgi:hypothetical protein
MNDTTSGCESGKVGRRMDGVQLNSPVQTQGIKEKRGISGSTVKIVAIVSMLIDHFGAAVISRQLMAEGLGEIMGSGEMYAIMDWLTEHATLYYSYSAIRMIGRIGFPIFCFLLVEGYRNTRNVKRYAMRLALFALISEVPFDLAFTGKYFELGYQNVYFTLFLGLFTLCVYDFFARYRQVVPESPIWMLPTVLGVLFPASYGANCLSTTITLNAEGLTLVFVILCLIVVGGLVLYGRKRGMKRVQIVCADMTVLTMVMYLADFMKTDYAGLGVLTITMMYIFRKSKVKSMAAGCAALTVMSISEATAFLSLIPISLYNGKRGLKMKYFFYAFYPVHLLLLYLLAIAMGLGSEVIF